MPTTLQQQNEATHQESHSAPIPDGFVETIGPHGEYRIVPEYLIPATHQAFEAYRKRVELDVRNEAGGVSIFVSNYLGWIHLAVPAADPDVLACRCRLSARRRRCSDSPMPTLTFTDADAGRPLTLTFICSADAVTLLHIAMVITMYLHILNCL